MFDEETMKILPKDASKKYCKIANIVGCKPGAVYRVCFQYIKDGYVVHKKMKGGQGPKPPITQAQKDYILR